MFSRLKLESSQWAQQRQVAWNYTQYLYQRVSQDRINVNAGYLAYITLLSLVPLLTVLISLMSAFSAFADVSEEIQDFLLTNLLPAAGDSVRDVLYQFVNNTGKMSAVGAVFLFITSISLISNIDKSLNHIWRIKTKRRAVFSFSMYWMVLTLGPILVGASIAVTSYITSISLSHSETWSSAITGLLKWIPLSFSFLAFTGLYLLVPNKKVSIRQAMLGGVVAGVLFELSKRGFVLYVATFPSYQLIYGALAAIPILFVWVYLCWMIVLFGAEVSAALGERVQWHPQWQSEADVVDSSSPKQVTQELNRDSTDSASK